MLGGHKAAANLNSDRLKIEKSSENSSTMIERQRWLAILAVLAILLLTSCSSVGGANIPAEDKFTTPAVGTLVPSGRANDRVNLPAEASGALVVNNSQNIIQVVVSATIATIQPTQGFLFILPPGSYEYYVYGNGAPKRYLDQVQPGAVRYIYILPPVK